MTTKEIKIQLALGSLPYNMKLALAINTNAPVEILTILSNDKSWLVGSRLCSW